jgi:phage repressor protein C with HTH and peptisase S24 domain
MKLPDDPSLAGRWTKAQREARGFSASDLARRISGLALEQGFPSIISQQVVSKFEQGKTKRMPVWAHFIPQALLASDTETKEDPYLGTGLTDSFVSVRRLPTYAGMGGGGTGEGDEEVVAFSRDLIERELRADPADLLAMIAEGNSMEPDFKGGDQILVHTWRKSLAQPGAFCLWDGDGHVIKFIEKVPGSDPPRVRIISLNPIYLPHERLLDEINLIGRVIWFGRRVQ